jgi:hypothetical protein
MEYVAAVIAVAVFIGFIAYRVNKGLKNKGSGSSTGGGGTGRRTEEK